MSLRLLVFEFITGGGLLGKPLPDSLRREGDMMREALLADLAQCPGIEVVAMTDPRCVVTQNHPGLVWRMPHNDEDTMAFYSRAIQDVAAVWPIAPETDGVLAQLAKFARVAGKQVLLSDAATLAVCGSKFATYSTLRRAGIAAIETYREADVLPKTGGPWLVKPDDGAGSVGVVLQASIHAAHQALRAESQSPRVLQPWCEGDALSLSLLCAGGQMALLAVNRQHIFLQNDCVSVDGLTVNAVPRAATEFVALSQQIAMALPGLWGYVGVDLIRSNAGILRVLEINPRLTTSYCGLRQALGMNVAALVLQLLGGRELPSIVCDRSVAVELNLAMDYG